MSGRGCPIDAILPRIAGAPLFGNAQQTTTSMPVPEVAPRSVAHPEIRKPADETVARFDGVSMVHVGREPGGGGGGGGPGVGAGRAPDAVPATSCTDAFAKAGAVVTSQFG